MRRGRLRGSCVQRERREGRGRHGNARHGKNGRAEAIINYIALLLSALLCPLPIYPLLTADC